MGFAGTYFVIIAREIKMGKLSVGATDLCFVWVHPQFYVTIYNNDQGKLPKLCEIAPLK